MNCAAGSATKDFTSSRSQSGITYISRIRPQRFESITHLTEHIQKIIVYLREHFGCTRKQLTAHFVPQPPQATTLPPTPNAAAPAPASETVAPAVPAPATQSEEDRVLTDLHWLIQDGYVVEFSNGRLWALADKPPQPVPARRTPPPTPGRCGNGNATCTEPSAATETAVETTAAPPSLPSCAARQRTESEHTLLRSGTEAAPAWLRPLSTFNIFAKNSTAPSPWLTCRSRSSAGKSSAFSAPTAQARPRPSRFCLA